MPFCPPLLLVLVFGVAIAWTATTPQLFVLQRGADGANHAQIYVEEKRRAIPLPLQYATSMTGNASLLFSSHGQRRLLAFVDPTLPGLGLRVAPDNALWARWRWAQWTNLTLRLFNQAAPPLTAPAAHATAVFSCGASPLPGAPLSFCDAGSYTLSAPGLPHELRDTRYHVIIDPDRPRGVLPPSLYFLLTNGRGLRPGGGLGNLTRAFAIGTACVQLLPLGLANGTLATPLALCDTDVAAGAFTMHSGARSATELRIGGLHWGTTFASVHVDGWTGTVRASYAPGEGSAATGGAAPVTVQGVQIAGAVIGALTLVLVYGRWAASPETLSIGLFLWHAHVEAARPGTHVLHWRVDFRLVVGTGLLLISAVSGTTVAWLVLAADDAAVALALPDGPAYRVLAGVLTGVGFFELAVASAASIYGLVYAVRRRQRNASLLVTIREYPKFGRVRVLHPFSDDKRQVSLEAAALHDDISTTDAEVNEAADEVPSPWWGSHNVPAAVAWIQHTAHGAGAMAFAILALLPLAVAGSVYGDRVLLFLLVPPALVLVGHLTYYGVGALGMALSPRLALQHTGWLIAASALQLAALLGVSATLAYYLLAPLLDVSSPFFSASVSMLAAVLTVALAVVVALALVQYEAAIVSRLVVAAGSPPPAPKAASAAPTLRH